MCLRWVWFLIRQIFTCCNFALGFLWVSEELIQKIYSFINSIKNFITYVRGTSLLELLNISGLLDEIHRMIRIESFRAVLALHINFDVILFSQWNEQPDGLVSRLFKFLLLPLFLFSFLPCSQCHSQLFLLLFLASQAVIVWLHLQYLLGCHLTSDPVHHHRWGCITREHVSSNLRH
jgi:hypothetical protein